MSAEHLKDKASTELVFYIIIAALFPCKTSDLRYIACMIFAHMLFAAALTATLSQALAQTSANDHPIEQPVLANGRENPHVNRLGLSPADLAREEVECSGEPQDFSTRGHSRTGINQWPGGVMPYEFDPNVTPAQQAAARAAMDELSAVANLTFVPRTTENDRVYFFASPSSNNSFLGRIGGSQTINIVNWNFRFIICHELMHALGIRHEHQRSDRDAYVAINNAALTAGTCSSNCSSTSCQNTNFGLSTNSWLLGLYDFDSVMHYSPTAFGCGSTTITRQPTPPAGTFRDDPNLSMGQRNRLSPGDIASLQIMYGAPCDSIDFNRDGLFPDDLDLIDFLSVLAGGPCSTGDLCGGIDFNNDDIFPSDEDLVAYLRVLAGGPC